MNILLITPDFYPQSYGGIGIYAYHLASELEKAGDAVTVVVLPMNELICDTPEVTEKGGVTVISFGKRETESNTLDYSVYRLSNNSNIVIRFLDKFLKNKTYDIVHCQDYYAVFAADYIRRTYGWPIVTTIHSESIIPRAMGNVCRGYMVQNSRKVITVSDCVKKDVEDSYKTGNIPEIITVYNGIDLERSSRREKEPGSDKYITFVGRLRKNKGCMILLEGFKGLSFRPEAQNLRLRVIGDGEMMEPMKQYVFENKMANVIFEGSMDNRRARDVIHGAMFHVVPSEKEGFGLSALEAMAEGIPVIASDRGGLPEFVKNRENGLLFRAGDVRDLVCKMQDMLSDPELRERMGERAAETAKQFTWGKMSAKIRNIYLSVN